MSQIRLEMQQVAGLTVGVRLVGEGQPILLLHGWGTSSESFLPILERLAAQGFACHALDLPGFGGSDMPPETWDVPRYMAFVLAYMDQAGLKRAALISHSFGGRISIVLAAEHPERISRMVLVNSAGIRLPPSRQVRAYYLARRVIFTLLKFPLLQGLEPRVREWFRQRYGSADYLNAGALVETFKRVIAQDLRDYAARITAPTLLVWGDQDEDTPLAIAHILEQIIPDAGLVVFEGAGHYSYLEYPLDFVRIVAHFFGDTTANT